MDAGSYILVVADAPGPALDAAAALSAAGYRVRTRRAPDAPPLLVVRQWTATDCQEEGAVGVLTVELGRVRGESLVDVVGRALGLHPRPRFASAALIEGIRAALTPPFPGAPLPLPEDAFRR